MCYKQAIWNFIDLGQDFQSELIESFCSFLTYINIQSKGIMYIM